MINPQVINPQVINLQVVNPQVINLQITNPRIFIPSYVVHLLTIYKILTYLQPFQSDAVWEPRLYEWQQEAANVLFFTFIHPVTMDVPPAFENLANTRGTDVEGAIPSDTVILFAIGKVMRKQPRQELCN